MPERVTIKLGSDKTNPTSAGRLNPQQLSDDKESTHANKA